MIDTPFSFAYQLIHDTPNFIMPGDTLTTNCTYDSPVTFGPGTVNEMCYNVVLEVLLHALPMLRLARRFGNCS